MTFVEALTRWHGKWFGAQSALAKAIGMKPNTVNQYTQGLRPGEETLPKIAKTLGVSLETAKSWWPEEPLSGPLAGASIVREPAPFYGAPVPIVEVPVVGRVAASGIDYAPDDAPRGTAPVFLRGPSRGRLEALQVAGDSMAPKIPDGSFVILKSRDLFKSGDVAVVLVDGQTLLKKVVVDGEAIALECLNKKHRSFRYAAKQVQILATVHSVVQVTEL